MRRRLGAVITGRTVIPVAQVEVLLPRQHPHAEEERIDRLGDVGGVGGVAQLLRREVMVAQVGDALREIGGVGGVEAGEGAVERLAGGDEIGVIARSGSGLRRFPADREHSRGAGRSVPT